MKGRLLKLVCIITAIGFFAQGCASLINGKMQDVGISSSPNGATANVSGLIVITPGTVSLKRNKNYTVVVEKEGYEPGSATVTSDFSYVTLINLVWFGGIIIGLPIDFITGSAWKLDPANVNVTLVKKTGS